MGKRMMVPTILIVALAGLTSGCLTATVQCPPTGQVTVTSNAPSVVTLALQVVAAVAPLLAAKTVTPGRALAVPTAEPTPLGTMTWKTFPLLGAQSASCGGGAAPAPAN